MDINKNIPATKNQITSTKPSVPKSIDNVLSGYIANSMNGGIIKPIAFKQIMAGEKIKEYKIRLKVKMLTPKTPTYQQLRMNIKTFFAPNQAIWENAEAYTAQKGGATVAKIEEIPNIGGKSMPVTKAYIKSGEKVETRQSLLCYTDVWRDAYISTYIPKIYRQIKPTTATAEENLGFQIMPKISVLPLRGFKAIYNLFLRNKEYDEELTEYKGDTVSEAEWLSYLPNTMENLKTTILRGKRQNSYYTDYRTEIQGIEEESPDLSILNNNLISWASWEAKIAEARSEAENAQLNDWDIIAKIRGSKKLSEGKVQLLSSKTFNLNYATVTQNTYNNNEKVDETFRVLGQQGAYSYTEVEIPLIAGMEFIEEGYIHIIAQVSADTVFEKGIDRLELNITPLDQYRPDLKDIKQDVLYEIEKGTVGLDYSKNAPYEEVTGFKRKYSEYFKLPNLIRADLGNDTILKANLNNPQETLKNDLGETIQFIPNSTFQFFEESDKVSALNLTPGNFTLTYVNKNIWQDYTDLMINKNQAILNETVINRNLDNFTYVRGQNQIFFIGECNCINDMPIDNAIKDSFTKWGEH